MRGWKKMWRMSVSAALLKNEKIWEWIVWIQKNNEFVDMWLVKNYQTFYEIKKFYFIFCIHKMYLISAEGYKNAGVHFLRVRKTGEIWSSMKDVHKGLGVKNMSDLILKEIYGIYETKNLTNKQIQKYKMTERNFWKIWSFKQRWIKYKN